MSRSVTLYSIRTSELGTVFGSDVRTETMPEPWWEVALEYGIDAELLLQKLRYDQEAISAKEYSFILFPLTSMLRELPEKVRMRGIEEIFHLHITREACALKELFFTFWQQCRSGIDLDDHEMDHLLPGDFFKAFLEYVLIQLFHFAEQNDPALVRSFRKTFKLLSEERQSLSQKFYSEECVKRNEQGEAYSEKWSNDYFQLAWRFDEFEKMLNDADRNPADRYYLQDNV